MLGMFLERMVCGEEEAVSKLGGAGALALGWKFA
jgi:hypothetical protein